MLAQLKTENVRRMLNLARLVATLIASKAVQITVLKASHCCPTPESCTERTPCLLSCWVWLHEAGSCSAVAALHLQIADHKAVLLYLQCQNGVFA